MNENNETTGAPHSANSAKPLPARIRDLVDSCGMILDAGELPEGDPALQSVFGYAELLEIRLSELTNVESLADEATRTFTVPDVRSKLPQADRDRWVHDASMAAIDHEKHLRKAESRVGKAKGLAETLRCALLSSDYDPEPFADEVVGSIIRQLDKAEDQMDRHSREHTNLFLAYFDRERQGGAS